MLIKFNERFVEYGFTGTKVTVRKAMESLRTQGLITTSGKGVDRQPICGDGS
jgi:hypothetical protein